MEIGQEFLKAQKHPHPRYGCVCGVAHMGSPETILQHFFQKYYPSLITRFFFSHVWWGGEGYEMTVNCIRCGHRKFIGTGMVAAVRAAYKWMHEHNCL